MISPASAFKLVNRGFDKAVCLIPGWATDIRIFSALELNYNYLLPVKLNFHDFEEALLDFINKNSLEKISLLGWSQGAFPAACFASKNPGRVEELILISTQERFDPFTLKDIERKIKINKRAFLYKFYLDFFCPGDKQGPAWFRRHLLKSYLKEAEIEDLVSGLDYLSTARIDPDALLGLSKILMLHGREDKICPFEQGLRLKEKIGRAEFIALPGCGHLPFFNQEFRKNLLHG